MSSVSITDFLSSKYRACSTLSCHPHPDHEYMFEYGCMHIVGILSNKKINHNLEPGGGFGCLWKGGGWDTWPQRAYHAFIHLTIAILPHTIFLHSLLPVITIFCTHLHPTEEKFHRIHTALSVHSAPANVVFELQHRRAIG